MYLEGDKDTLESFHLEPPPLPLSPSSPSTNAGRQYHSTLQAPCSGEPTMCTSITRKTESSIHLYFHALRGKALLGPAIAGSVFLVFKHLRALLEMLGALKI